MKFVKCSEKLPSHGKRVLIEITDAYKDILYYTAYFLSDGKIDSYLDDPEPCFKLDARYLPRGIPRVYLPLDKIIRWAELPELGDEDDEND